jgi:hypothetical protein
MITLLAALAGAVAAARAADVNTWLDRDRIGEGETVQLTLEVQGQASGRPDTAPLEQDFEVLGMSTGSRMNIVNGRTDARTTWTLTLSPRHSGRLTIPPLRVGNRRSAALTLEVADAPAPQPGSDADILIETELAPREPFVQGQVLYTVRLLHTVPISGGQLSEPGPDNTLVQRLGEDREYTTTRGDRRYQVIERRYALFPQTSGRLELPAPVFDGEIPDKSRQRTSPFRRFFGDDPFFGRDPFDDLLTPTRRVRVRGEPAVLDVQPRPAAAQGGDWLPAEQLELRGEWQPDATAAHVGEPVTLLLTVEARGLTGGQLSSPAPEAVDGFRVYPDQAQRQTDRKATGVTGRLQQKIAFLPERAGELALPPIEVKWWDTQENRERVARLPGRVLQVSPAAGQSEALAPAGAPSPPASAAAPARSAAPATAAAEPSRDASQRPRTVLPWPWISAVLAGGWLSTLLLWRRRTRVARLSRPENPGAVGSGTASTARKRFLIACQAGDAAAARRALLAWTAAHWPDDPPRGLEALAQRLPDPEVREALAELNRALYREGGHWNGTRLAKTLRRLPARDSRNGERKEALAPLYPEST